MPSTPNLHDGVEEIRHPLRIGIVEQRAVDVAAEALGLGGLDGGDRAVVGAGLAHRFVVVFLVAVEMDRPDEIRARLVVLHALFHQQRIGAQIDELPPRDDALDDRGQFLVQQRLAAGDRHHRRAALIDGAQRVLDRNALVEDFVGIVDLAATRAGEIAAEQRLQHQHERVALSSGQPLPDQITTDMKLLKKRNSHDFCLYPMSLLRQPTGFVTSFKPAGSWRLAGSGTTGRATMAGRLAAISSILVRSRNAGRPVWPVNPGQHFAACGPNFRKPPGTGSEAGRVWFERRAVPAEFSRGISDLSDGLWCHVRLTGPGWSLNWKRAGFLNLVIPLGIDVRPYGSAYLGIHDNESRTLKWPFPCLVPSACPTVPVLHARPRGRLAPVSACCHR